MTASKPPLDLRQLSLDRTAPRGKAKDTPSPRTKRWFSRYVFPISIVLGFAALIVGAAGNSLLPARPVTVIPVMVKRTETQTAGQTLFQSPGWIEPRPMAISVAAMAPGVIEELMVVAGQRVEKGEAIAKLVSVDAELTLQQAENALAIREGELKRAQAELAAARVRFDNPVQLRVQLADAQSNLNRSKTELAKLPFLIEAAKSSVKYAIGSVEGKRSARGAIPDNVIAKAENEHELAVANLRELEQRGPNLEREVATLESVVRALEQQLQLLVDETRQLREAEAKIQSATAYRDEAKLQVRQAQLFLERCTVRAPMGGRILRLLASPGTRVMGLEATAGQSTSTVVEMYDPQSLQVRADVRLEDVPLVVQGQPVEIETASSSQLIHGRVLQITSSANIQKNTLEVKVELIDPPNTVSPEMLVTTTFMAPKTDAPTAERNESEQLFVPRSMVQASGSSLFVWMVDEHSRARKQIIEIDGRSSEELVTVRRGLTVTDKLIASGLEDIEEGMRVRVTGDDQTIGMR